MRTMHSFPALEIPAAPANMSRDKSLPPQLYLFEHNMPSRKPATQVGKANHTLAPRKLTYAERVAQGNDPRYTVQRSRSELARSLGTVVLNGPNASSGPNPNPSLPTRTSTVRRQKAHDDLRMSAYCFRPLPVLPLEVTTTSQASADSQGKQQCVKAQLDERKHSKLNVAVRSVKDVVGRCKSKYARQTRRVRLSLAWEVEEIV
jgi:hypothetical protein